MKKPIILCVDDEKVILDSLWDQITAALGNDFDCELAESGEEGLSVIDDLLHEGKNIAVVISDQLMPGMKGDAFLIEAHRRLPQTLKILLTGQTSFNAVKNAINNARLYRYISKPWEENDFILTVTEAARSYQQYLQLVEHNRLLRALNRATQEISGEIEIKQLADRLLYNVLQSTGAEKGYLVVERMGALSIVAHAAFSNPTQTADEILVNENSAVGEAENQRIIEHLNHFVNANGSGDALRRANNYSIITPISKKGKELGYLYLENNLNHAPFSQNHLEVIEMLASQAAISIENARLYSNLQERSRELQAEKEKVEEMNQFIEARRTELEAVNVVIERKNKDIMDSIHYAKRIQEAILPDMYSLKRVNPNFFVLYRPKDVVSGDFYWWAINEELYVIAVADCTGHGVPGAFMSLIGANFLNQTINEYYVNEPSAILKFLDIQMRKALKHERQGGVISKEGMDIGVCCINRKTNRLDFAGARRPLLLFRDGVLQEIGATRISIAEALLGREANFELSSLDLRPGDTVYMFTDGITDQFGGPHNRKYTHKRLRECLTNLQTLNMNEQEKALNQEIERWRGFNEQTDDILFLGIQF